MQSAIDVYWQKDNQKASAKGGFLVVETAGIEPASASVLRIAAFSLFTGMHIQGEHLWGVPVALPHCFMEPNTNGQVGYAANRQEPIGQWRPANTI